MFLGEKSHSEEYVVMRESGHVVKGRAVRAAAREVSLTDRDENRPLAPESSSTWPHTGSSCPFTVRHHVEDTR